VAAVSGGNHFWSKVVAATHGRHLRCRFTPLPPVTCTCPLFADLVDDVWLNGKSGIHRTMLLRAAPDCATLIVGPVPNNAAARRPRLCGPFRGP